VIGQRVETLTLAADNLDIASITIKLGVENIIVLHVVIAVNIILWYPVDDVSVSTRPEAVTRGREGGRDLTQGQGAHHALNRHQRQRGPGGKLGGRVQLVGVGGGGGALIARLVRLSGQRQRLGPDLPADVDNDEDTEQGGDNRNSHTHDKAGHARVRVTLDTFPDIFMDQEVSSLTIGAGRGTVL